MRFAKSVSVWLICLSVIFAVVQPGSTQTSTDVDYTCPLCHTTFKASSYVSNSRLGMRLDLKPVGQIAAPWSFPKCPKCHFIVYDQELSDKDQELLQKFVNSKDYKDIAGDNASYFLLARLYETVGMDNYEIAHAYLKASWQVDKDRVKSGKYLEASLAKFQSFLSSRNKGISSQYIMAEMLSGEIERRLGKFDQALSRFSRIQKSSEFSGGNVTAIIEHQLELIAARDAEPHEIKM